MPTISTLPVHEIIVLALPNKLADYKPRIQLKSQEESQEGYAAVVFKISNEELVKDAI